MRRFPNALERCYVSEQKHRFIEDFLLNYYSVTEMVERTGDAAGFSNEDV
jgi:hypothetical protein